MYFWKPQAKLSLLSQTPYYHKIPLIPFIHFYVSYMNTIIYLNIFKWNFSVMMYVCMHSPSANLYEGYSIFFWRLYILYFIYLYILIYILIYLYLYLYYILIYTYIFIYFIYYTTKTMVAWQVCWEAGIPREWQLKTAVQPGAVVFKVS